MTRPPTWYRLVCPACRWQQRVGPEQMLPWLQRLGMLRRQAEPETDLLVELFLSSAGRYACPSCSLAGLRPEPELQEDWDDPRLCEACGKAIPAERLEVLPDTTQCPACQGRSEQGQAPPGADEFCRRCGGRLLVRRRAGIGLAGYRLVCSECGRGESSGGQMNS